MVKANVWFLDGLCTRRVEGGVTVGADEIEAGGFPPRHLVPKVIHMRLDLPTGPIGKLYRRGLRFDAESVV